MKVAYLFLNGELLGDKNFYKNFIEKEKGDIFCADGGANIAFNLGIIPLEIWGDLDSINKETLDYYKKQEVLIKKFPSEKDDTDSELLLKYLKNKKYEKIYCIAGLSGSIDHELTNINLCFKYKNLYFISDRAFLFNVEHNFVFKKQKDKEISFIIFSDKIKSLNLKGFKYEVENLNLSRGDSRCMSNIITTDRAEVSLKSGKLLALIKNKI